MDFRVGRSLGDRRRQMIGRRTQHGEMPGQKRAQRVAVGDVDHGGFHRRMRFDVGELASRPVGDHDLVVAAAAEQPRDGRTDLACADDDNAFHWICSRQNEPRSI